MSMVVDNEIPGPSLTSTEAKLKRKIAKVKENTCKILHGNRFMGMEVLYHLFFKLLLALIVVILNVNFLNRKRMD